MRFQKRCVNRNRRNKQLAVLTRRTHVPDLLRSLDLHVRQQVCNTVCSIRSNTRSTAVRKWTMHTNSRRPIQLSCYSTFPCKYQSNKSHNRCLCRRKSIDFFWLEIREWVQWMRMDPTHSQQAQLTGNCVKLLGWYFFFCAQMQKVPIDTFAVRSDCIDNLWTHERQRRIRFNTWIYFIQVRAQSSIMLENCIKFTITYFPYQSRA